METDDDKPIAREPWQRLLRERYDAPPEVTDARIRAAARRAYKSRATRWYLPVSLAASVVLAVMLVQWQYGDDRAPAYVSESDVAAPRAKEVREAPAARPEVSAPLAPPPAELEEYVTQPATSREREAPAAAITTNEPLPNGTATAPARAEAPRSLGKIGGLSDSAAARRDPEEWYEEIEALRAAGRIEDAEAEQDRLEAAWPGWLEKNHPQNR